jgi:hypothetical protein
MACLGVRLLSISLIIKDYIQNQKKVRISEENLMGTTHN